MSAQTATADTPTYMFERAAETMPRNELKTLQLARLKTTVERAYDKIPHYERKFDAAGVKPSDLKSLADIARFPVHDQGRSARHLSVRPVRGAARAAAARCTPPPAPPAKPTVVGYTKADLEHVDRPDGALPRLRMGARPGDIVHNAYGYGLFTGGLGAHYGAERLGCTVVPVSGGMTERQVTLLQDFGAHRPVRDAVLRAQHRRSRRGHGRRYPQAAAAARHLRRRAVERRHAPRSRGAARHRGGRYLWPVGDHRAGRRLRMPAWRRTGCTAGRIISCSR